MTQLYKVIARCRSQNQRDADIVLAEMDAGRPEPIFQLWLVSCAVSKPLSKRFTYLEAAGLARLVLSGDREACNKMAFRTINLLAAAVLYMTRSMEPMDLGSIALGDQDQEAAAPPADAETEQAFAL